MNPTTESIKADIHRHSQLHSWNKHIRHGSEGQPFYFFFGQGEQPRNGIHPGVKDSKGWHLWMIDFQPPASCPPESWCMVHITNHFGGYPHPLHDNLHPSCVAAEAERQRLMNAIFEKASRLIIDGNDRCRKMYIQHEEQILRAAVRAFKKNTNKQESESSFIDECGIL